MKKPHEMPSLPSNIAFGLGAAVLAACGTAVTVNPGFSPQAHGQDRPVAARHRQSGGLRGLVGGERPVEAIAAEVEEGLSDAGYPIRTLAAEIRATCEPLLGELKVARTGGERAATTTYGSGIRIEVVPAEEVAKEKAAVSTTPAPAPAPAPQPASSDDTAAPGPAPSPVGQGREQAVARPAPGQPGPVSEPVAAEPPSHPPNAPRPRRARSRSGSTTLAAP